jgi:hypothetical protein
MESLSVEAKEKLKTKIYLRCHDEGECKIWQGKSIDGSGYPVISVKYNEGEPSKTTIVHRLVYMIESGESLDTPNYHVSHLCHRKRCMSFQHLSYEPAATNLQRKTCVTEGKCFGHNPFRKW